MEQTGFDEIKFKPPISRPGTGWRLSDTLDPALLSLLPLPLPLQCVSLFLFYSRHMLTTQFLQATTTTTSSAPNPTCTALTSSTSAVCNHLSGGSDGCTPYIVTPYGVTLPYPVTFPSGGHVNVQTIPCSEYQCGQTYLNHGAFSWNPTTTNWNFDPNNNQPDGVYIGTNSIPFGPKLSAHYPNGFCVVWTQVSLYNQHYGEGGQAREFLRLSLSYTSINPTYSTAVCNCPA